MSFSYIINKFIELDPDLNSYLRPLANKTLALSCSDFPNKTIYCLFSENRLDITDSKPNYIDTAISGPLIGLIAIVIKKQNADLRQTKITITGDVATAELAQNLFFKLDIDWEEELSKYTGDIIAHKAVYLIKNLKNYQQQASISLEEMVTEYLQEESGLLPTQHEVNDFMQEVDNLRMRVDRLQARMNAYEND